MEEQVNALGVTEQQPENTPADTVEGDVRERSTSCGALVDLCAIA
jgi:hypothetical protein